MGIVTSASKAIQEAISRLRSGRPAEVDAAVARLTIIGRRAVTPLSNALPGLPPAGRVAVLDVLERIDDATALPAVLPCLDDLAPTVAARAVATAVALGGQDVSDPLVVRLRGHQLSAALAAAAGLGSLAQQGHVESLDALLQAAVDESQDDERRLAALAAAVPGAGPEIRQVLVRLTKSSSPRVAAEAASRLTFPSPTSSRRGRDASRDGEPSRAGNLVARATTAARRADTRRRWLEAIEAEGPDVLDAIHAALSSPTEADVTILLANAAERLARPASIPVLRDLLARLDSDPNGLRAAAAVHAALAALDSRVALEDLRQRLERATGPTAADLARSVGLVGDASFGASLASLASREADLEPTCAAAYRIIARRHHLTRRSRPVASLPLAARGTVARWLR